MKMENIDFKNINLYGIDFSNIDIDNITVGNILFINACREFNDIYHRLPCNNEIFRGLNIGKFIKYIKCGKYPDIKEIVEKIFGKKIKLYYKFTREDDEIISLCENFYREFNRFPKSDEKYNGFCIGSFMDGLKRGRHSQIKPIIEKIFNIPIVVKRKVKRLNEDVMLTLCKEFYDKYHRLPYQKEKYNDWNIGIFVQGIKYRKNKKLIKKVEEIFNQEITVRNRKVNDEEILNKCREFYDKYHRLPTRNDVYKDWCIGTFIQGLKNNRNKHLKDKVEEIFQQPINIQYRIYRMDDDIIVDKCQKFFCKYKRLPEPNEIFDDWKIGIFIQEIKEGKHIYIKPIVEKIFQTSL